MQTLNCVICSRLYRMLSLVFFSFQLRCPLATCSRRREKGERLLLLSVAVTMPCVVGRVSHHEPS